MPMQKLIKAMKKIITLFALILPAVVCFSQNPDFIYNSNTCYGQQTTLVASSSLVDDSIASWKWDMDNDGAFDDANGKTVYFLFPQPNATSVGLEITANSGAKDSITKTVTVNPLPNVDFFVNNLCEGKAATYISMSGISNGTINQYKWDFDNNGVDDAVGNDTVNYTCGPAQTYLTKLTCVSVAGCSAFALKTTQVYPQPTASFSSNYFCVGNNTVFTNGTTISNPDFYSWNFGDGNQAVTTGDAYIAYDMPGNYNVQLIAVTQSGCRDTFANSVTINPLPVISVSINDDDQIYDGESVVLTASGGTSYSWVPGGETTNSITVTNSGNYFVYGADASTCMNVASQSVTKIGPSDTVSVAGILMTPNGDGINDYLSINNIGAYKNCTVKIYNMWNDEVYSVSEYKNDWNGISNDGNLLMDGPYYYIITCDDKPLIKGNINILR